MKHIKSLQQSKLYELGEIRKVENQIASEKVNGGRWKFVSKTEYKLWKNGGPIKPKTQTDYQNEQEKSGKKGPTSQKRKPKTIKEWEDEFDIGGNS